MSKVRINDLARELEVKSRAILDALTEVGVTEKKTHSSSLKRTKPSACAGHFHRSGKNGAAPARSDSEPKPKIDWSRVSKPGDVLKAIQRRKEEAEAESPAALSPGSAPAASRRSSPSASAAPRWLAPVSCHRRLRPPPRQRRLPPPADSAGRGGIELARPSYARPRVRRVRHGQTAGKSRVPPSQPPPPPAPRRIVPQPRQEPRIVVASAPPAPAIAAKPPAGPVVAKPPASAWKCARRQRRQAGKPKPGPQCAGKPRR